MLPTPPNSNVTRFGNAKNSRINHLEMELAATKMQLEVQNARVATLEHEKVVEHAHHAITKARLVAANNKIAQFSKGSI
jgi:hypothetical protein